MVAVTGEHEDAGDDVMGKHLPVVFPPFFNVDNEHLLNVEGELDEVVPFEQAVHLSVRPAGPEFAGGEPVIGTVHEILRAVNFTQGIRWRVGAPSPGARKQCSMLEPKLAPRTGSSPLSSPVRPFEPRG